MRSDNFFVKGGFAERQVGECIAKPNDPNGFFCTFRNEDDCSFQNPSHDHRGDTRAPAGLSGIPGFAVQCNTNFDCPLPPPFPGGPPGFGTCVAGLTGGTCDLSAGSPRPNAGVFLSSTLVIKKDVDVAAYDYLSAWGDVTIVGIPQTLACKSSIHFFPTIAFTGPLDLEDSLIGAPLFLPLATEMICRTISSKASHLDTGFVSLVLPTTIPAKESHAQVSILGLARTRGCIRKVRRSTLYRKCSEL